MHIRFKHIIPVAALATALFVLSTCGSAAEADTTAPPTTPPTTTVVTTTAPAEPPQPEGLYTFANPVVQSEVEKLLGKRAADFTEADLAELRSVEAFRVSGAISTLADITALFPALAYLDIWFNDDIPDAVYDELAAMSHLVALEIYSSNGFARYDFCEHINYVNLMWDIDVEHPVRGHTDMAEAVLAGGGLTVTEGYTVDAITRYVDEGYIYEVVDSRKTIPGTDPFVDQDVESTLFIHKIVDSGLASAQVFPLDGRLGNIRGDLFVVDVDFDGQKDVMVTNGMFGTQAAIVYSCFLNRGGRFIACESFSEIVNAALDIENQLVLSTWRNHSASHSWATCAWQEDELVMTATFTEGGEWDEDKGKPVFFFRDERRIDGEMVVVNEVWETDYTEEEIIAMFYAPESEWGLFGDRWRTLDNMGTMIDFSIYNSTGVNAMIHSLIENRHSLPVVPVLRT